MGKYVMCVIMIRAMMKLVVDSKPMIIIVVIITVAIELEGG